MLGYAPGQHAARGSDRPTAMKGKQVAEQSTLYRVDVELSDIDRGVYESLALRVARHPSEDAPRMVTRVLAHALLHEPEMGFGKGLSSSEEPALLVKDATGNTTHWIDVGHPSGERLHRAAKATDRVSVVCHKGPEALAREARRKRIHRVEDIQVILLPADLVEALAEATHRVSRWTLVRTDSDLQLTVDEQPFQASVVYTTLQRIMEGR